MVGDTEGAGYPAASSASRQPEESALSSQHKSSQPERPQRAVTSNKGYRPQMVEAPASNCQGRGGASGLPLSNTTRQKLGIYSHVGLLGADSDGAIPLLAGPGTAK